MAVSLESAGKVRQKTRAITRNPGIFYALKAMFLHLATNKGNPDLQFIPFSEVECDVAGGTVLLTGASTLYAVYIKKTSSATDNFFWLYDDATDDTTAANARVQIPLLTASESQLWMHPDGLPLATGIVVTQYTGPLGTTDGSDGGDGFVIVGA